MPLFSIVIPHYQGSTPHRALQRAIGSIWCQTFTDYEILLYHDGPLQDTSVHMPMACTCTETRNNDWGHTLRDMGIRAATGEYILHLNSDNVLYPNALEELAIASQRPDRLLQPDGRPADSADILIYPAIMRGMLRLNGLEARDDTLLDTGTVLTGNPPVAANIDAMQLVMRRQLWLNEGGWYDRGYDGDGKMYAAFAQKYGYRTLNKVLGEHF